MCARLPCIIIYTHYATTSATLFYFQGGRHLKLFWSLLAVIHSLDLCLAFLPFFLILFPISMIITECGDPFIFLLGFVSQTRTLSLSVSQRLQLGVVLFISFLDLSQRCFLFLFYFPFVKEARCCCCWGKIFSFFFLSIELSSKTEKEKVLFYLNLPFERLCVPRGKASLCLLLYFLRIIRQLFFSSIK